MIFFLHLPKSGGLTLQKTLIRYFGPQKVQELKPNYKDHPECTQLEWLRYTDEYAQSLKEEDVKGKLLFMGHFCFGIHTLLNIEDQVYITIIRNPLDRVVSEFYYFKKLKYDIFNKANSTSSKDDITVEEYVEKIMNDNIQTRMLSANRNFKINAFEQKELALAKENLGNTIYGITEKYDDTLAYFNKRLNINIISYRKLNMRHKSEYQPLNSSLRSKIERRNELDMALWDYAREEFSKEISNNRLYYFFNNIKLNIKNKISQY